MITQEYLKELLHYDPDTGVFTWKVSKGPRAMAGSKAGSISKGGATNYLLIQIDGSNHKAHRIAWLHFYGIEPDGTIDHIDHDGLNNRINNLREVSHQENMKNMRLSRSNTSGVTGVGFNKAMGKWAAYIVVDYIRKHLGYFDHMEEAVSARKKAESRHGFHENHGKSRTV